MRALLDHLYDTRGSDVFEQICALPEYYPTRTELSILSDRDQEIIEETGATELVELGSGAADEARILLDAMAAAGTLESYAPFDVSEQVVRDAAQQLVQEYDGLHVHGVFKAAGLQLAGWYTEPEQLFALSLASPAA